jgi:type I restriction enzyme S subunit
MLPLLQEVMSEEFLHDIPSNWVWTRLGEIVNYTGAKKVLPSDISSDSWLLDLEDIEKDTSRILSRKTFQEKESKSTKAEFNPGDVLYGKLRPYLNKVLVADNHGYCTTEIVPLKPYEEILSEYIKYILKRPDFLDYVNSKTYGINLPRLGTEDGRKALFPLPPLAEQKRIVEKVDRLLVLCDAIGKHQQQRQQNLLSMNDTTLAQLLTAPTPDDFQHHWQGLCNNFDLLYSVPETIPKLRQAILQLAVRGKLAPQNPNDEDARIVTSQ